MKQWTKYMSQPLIYIQLLKLCNNWHLSQLVASASNSYVYVAAIEFVLWNTLLVPWMNIDFSSWNSHSSPLKKQHACLNSPSHRKRPRNFTHKDVPTCIACWPGETLEEFSDECYESRTTKSLMSAPPPAKKKLWKTVPMNNSEPLYFTLFNIQYTRMVLVSKTSISNSCLVYDLHSNRIMCSL